MLRLLSLLTIFLCSTLFAFSSSEETESGYVAKQYKVVYQKKKSKDKNLKFNIMGGPSYNPDFGFLLGGATLLTFSTNPQDKALPRSVLPISLSVTFAKPIGVIAIMKPELFCNEDKLRLTGIFMYKSSNDNYSGVGFETAHDTYRSKATTGYTSSTIRINPIIKFKIPQTNIFIGPMVDYVNEDIIDPGSFVVSDPLYLSQGGTAEGISFESLGIGINASYDTRDITSNAYEGIFVELKVGYYSKVFSDRFNYTSIILDYRQYVRLSQTKRRILAWNIVTKNLIGDAPFTRYPSLGGPFDLRGYYSGQYRDDYTISTVLEYRHMLDFGNSTNVQKFFSRLGFAVWAGVGSIGERNIFDIQKLFPNIGAGLRFELQPRINFRFDVGYSPVDKQTLLYFNITETF